MNTILKFFLLIVLLCTSVLAQAAVTVSVDRNPVALDESLQVVFESESAGDPDFTPLEQDFDILNRSQSSSIQIINGKMSSKQRWQLTLMAKRVGTLVIPAIAFGSEVSGLHAIKVTDAVNPVEAGNNEEIFLEVSAEPKRAYVQGQVLYTVRLYRAVNLSNASLSEPKPSDADAVVQRLGEDSEFETQRNGRRYVVVERRYALFPQQSGKLTIDPVIFEGQIIQSSSRFMFDPFAQNVRTKRLRSQALEIEVNAIPAAQQGAPWLPAKDLQLVEEWPQEPPQFKVGEAVTRSLTIVAEGLTSAQLPELQATLPQEIKHYPDQPVLNDQKKPSGVIGVRQQKTALIPLRPGEYVLPEIKLKWWNTQTQQAEVAVIPERKIEVAVVAQSAAPPAISSPAGLPEVATPAIGSGAGITADSSEAGGIAYWPWISLALVIGWLTTFLLLWRKMRKLQASHAEPSTFDNTLSRKIAEKRLQQACTANAAPAAKEALLLWGRIVFTAEPPTSLGALARRLGGEAEESIITLNQALYGKSAGQWEGAALWRAISACPPATSQTDRSQPGLEPLYR